MCTREEVVSFLRRPSGLFAPSDAHEGEQGRPGGSRKYPALLGPAMFDMIERVAASAVAGLQDVDPMTIDYRWSFERMRDRHKYLFIDENITAENFPMIGRGIQTVKPIPLMAFPRFLTSDAVVAEMGGRCYLPAKLEHLFALTEEFPFPVVALGSKWKNKHGAWVVPRLSTFGGRRELRLEMWRGPWTNVGLLALLNHSQRLVA